MTSLIRKAMNKFSTSSFGWRYDCNTSSQEDSYHSFFSRSNSRSEAAIRPVQKSSSNCNRKSHSSSRVSKHLVVHKSRLMRSTAEKPYVRTKRNPCAQNYQKQKPLDDTRSAVASATKAAILTKSSLPIFSTTLDQKSIQEDIATRSMAYIYADIHAASTPGVIPQTFDLVPMNPQSKGFCQESWIYSNLALQTREMLKVIGWLAYAYLNKFTD